MSGAGTSITADQKAWDTARAAAAMRGIELLRTDPADGGVQRLVAVRGRQAYVVDTLDQLEAQLIGAPTVLTT